MSGSQTYSEMIHQPAATDAEVAAAFYPVLIAGTNGSPATTKLAASTQINLLVKTGTIVSSEKTFGNVATTIPSLPLIATAGGNVLLQGFIVAQDQATGDCAMWDISLLVKRVPNGVSCTTVGDANPSLFAAEGTLANLAFPVLGANSSGPVISMVGLPGVTISWDYNFSFITSSIS